MVSRILLDWNSSHLECYAVSAGKYLAVDTTLHTGIRESSETLLWETQMSHILSLFIYTQSSAHAYHHICNEQSLWLKCRVRPTNLCPYIFKYGTSSVSVYCVSLPEVFWVHVFENMTGIILLNNILFDRFCRRQGVSGLAEWLIAYQEGLCSMELAKRVIC